jgi:squalene cyclase
MAVLPVRKGSLPMMRPIAAAVLAGALFGPVVATGRAAPPDGLGPQAAGASREITADFVRQAIDRGVTYLKSQQHADGTWSEDFPPHFGGVTALCTLALLNAGVEPQDPCIQRALAVIRKLRPETTYATSLATMVLARAEPARDASLINTNVKWLEHTQIPEGPHKGAWSYQFGGGRGDNSNAQFALLALHEAERAGVAVNDKTWRLAKKYWENCQNADGSWGYYTPAAGTGSMTCAGITSLVIASDRIQPSNAKVTGDQIDCCVVQQDEDQNRIENAVKWMSRHFAVGSNPGYPSESFALYYL